LRVEKECSTIAVVTGKVTSTCSGMDRFGYRDALHAVYASSAVFGGSAAYSMPALLPQLKLGSDVVVTVVDECLIHFHRR